MNNRKRHKMKLLFIGDVVGTIGQQTLKQSLSELKKQYKPQVTIVNGENIADGRGITEKLYRWLMSLGVDAVTLGNHAWDKRDIIDFMVQDNALVRPINLPKNSPGKGIHYIKVNQFEIAIINLLGSVFMSTCIEPFTFISEMIEEVRQRTPIIFIDFHAEATSEKQALGYALDGKVSAVVGTHTHVQTNDARILPQGTAYLTDVGMTGCLESVIGFNYQQVVQKFKTHLPMKLEQATTGDTVLSGCVIEIEDKTGTAKKIETIYWVNGTSNTQLKYRHV